MPQRIPTHRPRPQRRRPRDETARPNAYQRGYCDRKHRAWRQAVLTRDAWACVQCGHVDNANHADHIVPIALGGDRYSVANGQTLCQSCHSRKTRTDSKR